MRACSSSTIRSFLNRVALGEGKALGSHGSDVTWGIHIDGKGTVANFPPIAKSAFNLVARDLTSTLRVILMQQ